jgi:hypothetical protein
MILAVLAGPVRAEIMLGKHDWDPTGTGLWTDLYDSTTVSTAPVGGHTGGWMQVSFPATAQPQNLQAGWYDVAYTKATNLYAGTWNEDVWVEFDFWASNVAPGATEAQYLADLASIDWIGVYIYRNTADLQIYGIDDFKLMIPEPAEYLVLALALATTGLSLHRKRLQPEPVRPSDRSG